MTGVQTFPRPKGIPENFVAQFSDKPGGMKYVHPTDTGTFIRVMPGKPHSPFPYQQNPYVVQQKCGKTIDNYGNIVDGILPEAHIPLEEFIYRSN